MSDEVPVMDKRWIRKANREEVVQAALVVERWCAEHFKKGDVCDCPFGYKFADAVSCCALYAAQYPIEMDLEEFLRNRGAGS